MAAGPGQHNIDTWRNTPWPLTIATARLFDLFDCINPPGPKRETSPTWDVQLWSEGDTIVTLYIDRLKYFKKIHFCHNVHRWHISNRVLAVHLLVKPLMDFCHSGWVGLWQAQQLQLARRATAGRHQNHLRHQHFWRCLAERYLKPYWNKELFKCLNFL